MKKEWFELLRQVVVNILMGLWKALANGECDGGDNNDVVELEKLQGELGWLVRIRAADINVG